MGELKEELHANDIRLEKKRLSLKRKFMELTGEEEHNIARKPTVKKSETSNSPATES